MFKTSIEFHGSSPESPPPMVPALDNYASNGKKSLRAPPTFTSVANGSIASVDANIGNGGEGGREIKNSKRPRRATVMAAQQKLEESRIAEKYNALNMHRNEQSRVESKDCSKSKSRHAHNTTRGRVLSGSRTLITTPRSPDKTVSLIEAYTNGTRTITPTYPVVGTNTSGKENTHKSSAPPSSPESDPPEAVMLVPPDGGRRSQSKKVLNAKKGQTTASNSSDSNQLVLNTSKNENGRSRRKVTSLPRMADSGEESDNGFVSGEGELTGKKLVYAPVRRTRTSKQRSASDAASTDSSPGPPPAVPIVRGKDTIPGYVSGGTGGGGMHRLSSSTNHSSARGGGVVSATKKCIRRRTKPPKMQKVKTKPKAHKRLSNTHTKKRRQSSIHIDEVTGSLLGYNSLLLAARASAKEQAEIHAEVNADRNRTNSLNLAGRRGVCLSSANGGVTTIPHINSNEHMSGINKRRTSQNSTVSDAPCKLRLTSSSDDHLHKGERLTRASQRKNSAASTLGLGLGLEQPRKLSQLIVPQSGIYEQISVARFELSAAGRRPAGTEDEELRKLERDKWEREQREREKLVFAWDDSTWEKPKNTGEGDDEEHKEDDHINECNTCGTGGELVMCDNCPLSFHMLCAEPPLSQDTVPEGEWLCCSCKAEKIQNEHAHVQMPTHQLTGLDNTTPWDSLIVSASASNPCVMKLPYEIEEVSKYSPYIPWMLRNGATSATDDVSTISKDKCSECGHGAAKAQLVTCNYCPLTYHADCVTPALPTVASYKWWMCPAHVDHALEALRRAARLPIKPKSEQKSANEIEKNFMMCVARYWDDWRKKELARMDPTPPPLTAQLTSHWKKRYNKLKDEEKLFVNMFVSLKPRKLQYYAEKRSVLELGIAEYWRIHCPRSIVPKQSELLQYTQNKDSIRMLMSLHTKSVDENQPPVRQLPLPQKTIDEGAHPQQIIKEESTFRGMKKSSKTTKRECASSGTKKQPKAIKEEINYIII
eukprot:CFRG1475T1